MCPSSQPASVQANPSSFIPVVCCRRSFTARRSAPVRLQPYRASVPSSLSSLLPRTGVRRGPSCQLPYNVLAHARLSDAAVIPAPVYRDPPPPAPSSRTQEQGILPSSHRVRAANIIIEGR
jgi:hypothetical protein